MKHVYLKIIFVFTLHLCSNFAKSQDHNLPDNISITQITSINWRQFDYGQLKVFEKILDKHDILVLSEIYHGDGASYDAQCTILKGLIDSNKINTIYTESSWINIDRMTEELKLNGKSAIRKCYKYMRSTELKYWADNGFWDYLANKIIEGKIELRGVDITGISEYVVRDLFEEAIKLDSVKEYIKSNTKVFDGVKFDYEHYEGWGLQSRYDVQSYNYEVKFINTIITDYTSQGNKEYLIKQWKSILGTFYWMYKRSLILENNKYSNVIEGEKQNSLFHSKRDSIIADNFLNDYKQRVNKKSVVLISCYHSVMNTHLIDNIYECCSEPGVHVWGNIVNKKLGEKIYSISFIWATGESAINYYTKGKPYKVKKTTKNTLEYSLEKKLIPYLFLDLKSSTLNNVAFTMQVLHKRFLRSTWSNNFSGIFFINKMYPLNFVNPSVLLREEEIK